MASLLLLGFASGLPYLLVRDALQAWLTVSKVDLGTIGFATLVSLPYSLKFLWSPLIDRFVPPWLGRRRGWLVVTQIGLVGAIGLMALQNPRTSLSGVVLVALGIAFLSASQDIAFDAYRTDVLTERELGAGAAVGVLGYRIALLVAGSLALVLADHIPWPAVYLLMAAVMGLSLFATAWAVEPARPAAPPARLADAVRLPFLEFWQRLGAQKAGFVLVFILLYKLGDSLAAAVATSFLLQTGFSQTDIGTLKGGFGLVVTILGTLTGGAILSRIGVNRSLWVFGGLQAVSNLAYVALALTGKNYALMVGTIGIENFSAGLGTAAFVAFLMSLCNPRFSATQYALLSSLMAVSRDIIASPSGKLAELTGWPMFFLITLGAALPGLLLLPLFAPWKRQTSNLHRS